MVKTEKIKKETCVVYDISLDGTFINALGMNVQKFCLRVCDIWLNNSIFITELNN